ncbi:MAG TPA: hypothetical protein VIW26_16620 [Gemmatimonadales bacterium]|jgi:hypothetical protein
MTQTVNVPGVGTLNFPDGMSQADMAAAIQRNFPQIHQQPQGGTAQELGLDPNIYGPGYRGPSSTQVVQAPLPTFRDQGTASLSLPGAAGQGEQDITRGAMQEVAQNVAAGDQNIPLMQSEAFHEKSVPVVMGGLASAIVPGSGWGALALQSLMAGAGTGGGELIRQQQAREPRDLAAAGKAGAVAGVTTLGTGAALKGLGAAAKAIFSSPLSEPQKAAAEFAKQEGAPFPLSSAMPGSGAARVQQSTRALIPGELRTQTDANRVTQFLNNRVGTIVDNATPVDEAALKGQQYLRQAFEPGETVYTQTFKDLRATVGDETPVKLTETLKAMEGASEALKQRGEMKGVYNRLRNVLKAAPEEQTVAQLDELYSGLLKDTARNANARREANVVLNAIGKDLDAVTADFGVSFSDAVSSAKAVRDQFRDLRNIPQLERLSQPFGEKGGTLGSRQWMSELFSNPNGKALAEVRARNPELYHELADSWLANNLNRFSKPVKEGFGKALDGKALRAWYEQNQGAIKLIYGAPQAKALDNFSLYAQYMAGAVDRAASGGGRLSDPMVMLARGGAEATAAVTHPYILIPGEAASYVLAKGLSDPSSQLFKVFTEGFSPGTRSFVLKSGELGAQAAARDANTR